MRELASEIRQWPRELVAEALKSADVYVKPGSIAVDEKALEEARARLRELAASIGISADKLMLWASVTHKAAEAVRRIKEAEEVLRGRREILEILNKGGGVSDKELAKLRSGLRELARALQLYPELAEFLRSPSFGADLSALARAAERLGLPEAVRFISAVEEARFVVDKHGFRRYYSEAHQEALKTAAPRWQKALLKAPIGAHVVNAMGLDLAREVFARYELLKQFGDVLIDISPYVPARLGLPAPVFDPALIGVVTPPKPYPEKVARHIASWDDLGVQEGIRRFYKTELGRRHRAVAEIAALGARAVAFRRLAERLIKEGREGGDVYKQIAGLLIAARAAREEVRIAALAEAAGLEAKLLREEAVRLYASAVGEAFSLARNVPVYELAERLRPLLGNKARLVIAGARGEGGLRRALERLSAVIDLRELYRIFGEAYLARAMYAEYAYRSLAKGLRERPKAVEPGYAAEAARALEGAAAYKRRVVEEAVAAAVPDWLRQRLEELRGALQTADPSTAPSYLKPYARGSGDFRKEVNAFLEEVRRAAEFSPAAKQALAAVAKYLAGGKLEKYEGVRDWLPGRDAVAKYLGVRMLQVLREVEPARAPTHAHLERLPEALRRAAAVEERVLVREGYFDDWLRAVYKALNLEFTREHPARAAARLEGALESLAARHGLSAEEAVKALRELGAAPIGASLEKAKAAGEAVARVLAEAARVRILEEVERRGAYYDADLAYREVKALLERVEKIAAVKFAEEAVAEILIRLVDAERLREGLLSNQPVPFGVLAARDVETALALGRRFKIVPVDAEFLEGEGSRVERLYLVVHPALEEALERLKEQVAEELAKRHYLELRHLGAAPPEVALKIPGVVGVREGGALHLYVRDEADKLAKAAAKALAEGDRETASRLLKRLRLAWLLVAKKYGVGLRGDEAVGYAVMKELIEALRAKWLSGEREALFKWAHDPEIAAGMARALGGEGDPDLLIFGVKYWLEWLVRGSLAPPDFPEALIPAARLYAEITLEPYRDVLMRIYRRLGEIRAHYAQRLREVVEAELRRIGALPEEARPPERRPEEARLATGRGEEKPAEAEKLAEAKRLPERPEGAGGRGAEPLEKPAEAAEPAGGTAEAAAVKPPEALERPAVESVQPAERLAEAAKPPTEAFEKPTKAIEKPSAAEEFARRAAGLIPDGVFGVQAALWLRLRLGAREVGHEEARWLGEAARRAKEYALAKALRGEAPEALREYLEEAGARAWAVLSELAASPEAVRYASLAVAYLEDAYRGVLETGFAQDAYRLFKPVIDAARRAEEELGAGDVVIRFVDLFITKFLKEAERAWERAYKAAATIEQALKAAAVSAAGTAGLIATHDAVFSSLPAVAAAIALARAEKYREAAEAARKAAERIYEAAKEIWEAAKVALERIIEIVVEAIARALDYVKAHWFLLAAAAAGLIAYSLAQQLDYQLWMEHVAKLAPIIVGAPKFKEFKLALEGEAPGLLAKAEEAVKRRGEGAVRALLKEGREALNKGEEAAPKLQDLKKVVEEVNKHRAAGEEILPEHAVVVWAVFEAGLKMLGKPPSLEEAAERLKEGKKVELDVREIAEYMRRIRDTAHELRLLFEYIAENAEKLATNPQEAEAMKREFRVTEAAEGLAEATKNEFDQLGDATLADKAVAFFESLARGTSWSRVVMNAMEKGKTYRALVLAPATAAKEYRAGRGAADVWENLLMRAAVWLAGRGVDKAEFRRKGNQVEIIVGGEAVAVVEIKRGEGGGTTYVARGRWVKEEAMQLLDAARELAKAIEASPGDYAFLALLATDGSYDAKRRMVQATTTSVAQAALYIKLGLEVKYAGYGLLTEEGLKPMFIARRADEKAVERLAEGLAEAKALLKDPGRAMLLYKALDLLQEIQWNSAGAKREAAERIMTFLFRLRLGEGGEVCLANCQFGEPTLTAKHEAYARVVAPLLHYIAREVPKGEEERVGEEVMKFLAHAILYDGHVAPDEVYLAVGGFGAKSEGKKLPMDMYDKVALYIILAAKYGVEVKGIYVGKGEVKIHLKPEYAAWVFAAERHFFSQMLREGKAMGIGADHVIKKLEKIGRYVEELAEKIRIERELREEEGKPKLIVRFKDKSGRELAHINVGWDGESLRAVFNGARENAERLASILNALGAAAEARQHGRDWRVVLYTDSITAIRRAEWLEAVRILVEELHRRGVISNEKRKELLRELAASPNAIEIAGVEMSATAAEKKTGSKRLEISYQPTSAEAFEAAVKALREAGFEEGVHFTAKRPEKVVKGERESVKQGYIRLKVPAGLWKLEELRRQGVKWAAKAVSRLEEIARARGFYDLVEKHLRPAREAETIDPRGMTAEDPERGVKAVIRDVKVMWEGGRPRIVVEYEVNRQTESFSFIWDVATGRKVIAGVNLNYEKAAILAALTGDELLKGKKGTVTLTARHLFAMARIKDVGWELLRWYAGGRPRGKTTSTK
ncbi:PaRep2b protein [Pyrobaculum aerophilum]|uniref:PaRep2b protein n=1 Tax=Pyrobaculum aerophilum TaxID=13773 RepID=UPI002FDA55D0